MICRDQFTKDDVKVFAFVTEQPSADLYPSASQWYQSVASKLATRCDFVIHLCCIFLHFDLILVSLYIRSLVTLCCY